LIARGPWRSDIIFQGSWDLLRKLQGKALEAKAASGLVKVSQGGRFKLRSQAISFGFKGEERASTGVHGLDEILGGGLPCNRLYVIQGEPGSGKTTLALQFLLEGAKRGERSLYVTFSETKEELMGVARSHGWSLDGIDVIDLSAIEEKLTPDAQNTLFHPSEVELNQLTDLLLQDIDRIKPSRIVFDSVSEMRLLSESVLRYRRQILALKQAFAGRRVTVIFLDDRATDAQDPQVQSIAHGVIGLKVLDHEFGGERRRLKVLKLRGVKFMEGNHDYIIGTGGLKVFPRMIAGDHDALKCDKQLSSGIVELDELLGGGLDCGTSTLFMGSAGTGKSTLTTQFALSAAKQGQQVAFFSFEETVANLAKRTRALGMDFAKYVEAGTFQLEKIDPAELSPGEFSMLIRNMAEKGRLDVLVIDSLNGYLQAMPQEQYLTLLLHELLTYLNNRGVVTLMVLAQQGMIGAIQAPVDLTYLADAVVLTRYFEVQGSIRKAISIVKKRTGKHESTLRELMISKNGVRVGPVLQDFEGILTGTPRYFGATKDVLHERR
jgi:circadian clock protein KaiC